MEDYATATYGDRMAAVYDEHIARTNTASDPNDAANFLATLAPSGRILELGIGTGRVALPLQDLGVEVHGIDASEAMVDVMRAKAGGAEIPVAIGAMADTVAPASGYDVAFVVFNTFFANRSQREQVRTFANVASVLRPGGRFVIEAFVPDPTRFDRNQRMSVITIDVDEVYFDVNTYDPVGQRVDASHVRLRNGMPVEMRPVSLRFAWPSELDLMAELAGLELEARHGGWRGEPFTAASAGHVSVWVKPA